MDSAGEFPPKYYVQTSSGRLVYCDQFAMYYRAYDESGLFILLAGAFTVCREKGYVLPGYLLTDLEAHLSAFARAERKKDGLSALGFDSNSRGGGWQGVEALAKLRQSQKCHLMEAVLALAPETKKTERGLFTIVSRMLASGEKASAAALKNLYYRVKKNAPQ